MAFSISFQRSFVFKPWLDRIDRVSAGGDHGFNAQFQTIEADLDTIGARFGDATNALNSLAQGVELERTVNVAPVLTVAGPTGWDTSGPGVARKLAGVTSAAGQVPVALPPGGRITNFRALGSIAGTGSLRLDLTRQDLTGNGQTQVVRITASSANTNPFDLSKAPSGGSAIDVIDPFFSYFILARLDGAAAADNVFLTGFQVVYQAR
jgi:hypothetical protein